LLSNKISIASSKSEFASISHKDGSQGLWCPQSTSHDNGTRTTNTHTGMLPPMTSSDGASNIKCWLDKSQPPHAHPRHRWSRQITLHYEKNGKLKCIALIHEQHIWEM
jgi:hypothetical protein